MARHYTAIKNDRLLDGLMNELWDRFRQLQYICEQVEVWEKEVRQHADAPGGLGAYTIPGIAIWKAALYAETFYMIAFRIVDVTRVFNKKLFGKKVLCKEPAGVRNVRHKLVIHPEEEKDKAILTRSYYLPVALDIGIQLKNIRAEHESKDFGDKGLWNNRRELRLFWLAWYGATIVELRRIEISTKNSL